MAFWSCTLKSIRHCNRTIDGVVSVAREYPRFSVNTSGWPQLPAVARGCGRQWMPPVDRRQHSYGAITPAQDAEDVKKTVFSRYRYVPFIGTYVLYVVGTDKSGHSLAAATASNCGQPRLFTENRGYSRATATTPSITSNGDNTINMQIAAAGNRRCDTGNRRQSAICWLS